MNKDFINIINSALSGDNSAFEILYNMTKDKAYFIALSLTHNEHDAMDILQDSYLKAFSNLDKVNPPETFDNWLNRIIANQSKDFLKKKKPVLFADVSEDITVNWDESEKDEDFIPEQALDNNETSRMIMEIINSLPEDQQLCILMYYYQDMSIADIASTLELPVSTVKYKLSAARKTIKAEVEKLEKNGTKLYAAFPFAMLPSIINQAAQGTSAPSFSALSAAVGTAASAGAAVSSGTTASAAATKTTGGIGMIFKTTMAKIIAAAVAVAVVGGITTAVILGNNNKNNPQNPASVNSKQQNSENSVKPSDNTSSEISYVPTGKLIKSGKCGENATWSFYEDGTLIVDGTGDMFGYKTVDEIDKNRPYNDYISQTKNIIIKDGITSIGEFAFSSCTCENVTIANTVKSIENSAFLCCFSLKNLTIPDSITSIGMSAFSTCSKLEEVKLPSNLLYLKKESFQSCSKLQSITIPKTVKEIEAGVFLGCKSLKDVTIEGGVELIDVMAFQGAGFDSITIPESVKDIGTNAFDNTVTLRGKPGSAAEKYGTNFVAE